MCIPHADVLVCHCQDGVACCYKAAHEVEVGQQASAHAMQHLQVAGNPWETQIKHCSPFGVMIQSLDYVCGILFRVCTWTHAAAVSISTVLVAVRLATSCPCWHQTDSS